jgi:hypothetical protein
VEVFVLRARNDEIREDATGHGSLSWPHEHQHLQRTVEWGIFARIILKGPWHLRICCITSKIVFLVFS